MQLLWRRPELAYDPLRFGKPVLEGLRGQYILDKWSKPMTVARGRKDMSRTKCLELRYVFSLLDMLKHLYLNILIYPFQQTVSNYLTAGRLPRPRYVADCLIKFNTSFTSRKERPSSAKNGLRDNVVNVGFRLRSRGDGCLP